jgi:FMN-dependent NADH-azoreductase
MLDLYRDNIQRLDTDVLSGLGKMHQGHHFAALTLDEQRKIGRVWRLTEQFIAADKYVFVTTMRNLGFPAELRMYIDTVCVENKTYHCTANGPAGLLKGQGRKCLLIYKTDELISGVNDASCVSYLKSVMRFMGIEEFTDIALSGVVARSDKVRTCPDYELSKAVQTAVIF